MRFIMNGANHRMDGPSTFPFPIMGGSWAEHFDLITGLPGRGDTVVGHDVWLGYRTLVMPGVRIGHGAAIASGSVVVDDVPDYGIAGGNPAKLLRRRYPDQDIDRLLALAWWDWPLPHITEHLPGAGTSPDAALRAREKRSRPAQPAEGHPLADLEAEPLVERDGPGVLGHVQERALVAGGRCGPRARAPGGRRGPARGPRARCRRR
ncbi:hypothetical protein GCM10009727_42890 [Actinomadura napierensis]|uniref:CatB-related O-acetyltransferase n=1 Tax=Actinomadura napierensis TaxID=267854 RepID=A0ABN2ZKM6_9ACTN